MATEVHNIFEEEQTQKIAEVMPPMSAASEPPLDSNQVDHGATADARSENLIIHPWQKSLNTDHVHRLLAHGLEVDDSDEPVPENSGLPPAKQQWVWTMSTMCHQNLLG